MKLYKTRREASLAGESKYHTGVECVNGHIADRYTTSGTCSQCVSLVGIKARYGTEGKRTEAVVLRQAKAEAVRDLVEVKLRCYMSDLDQLRAAVVAVTLGRYPILAREQVISAKPPGANEGGTQLHKFNVSSQDVDQLRAISNAMLNQKGPDMAKVKQRILDAVLKSADDDADPTPDFVP